MTRRNTPTLNKKSNTKKTRSTTQNSICIPNNPEKSYPSQAQDKLGPKGELQIRIMAMPENTNANGDIFGGWILSLMDLAGSSIAQKRAQSRVVTVAIESMSFLAPVKVGDFVCCYAELLSVGRTSMRIDVEAWVVNQQTDNVCQVTKGVFTFVAVNEQGKPIGVDARTPTPSR